jgi:hypothetical protein
MKRAQIDGAGKAAQIVADQRGVDAFRKAAISAGSA